MLNAYKYYLERAGIGYLLDFAEVKDAERPAKLKYRYQYIVYERT